MNNKESAIRVLPTEGLISLKDLAGWLGLRIDKLKDKLEKANVKTANLSRNARFRFVSMKELEKLNLTFKPYKKQTGFVKADTPKSPATSLETKKDQMTLQEMKEMIRFETDNSEENERLRGELMNSHCFGKRYGEDCCQNCTLLVDLDGTKGPLKLFCEAISD